MNIFLVTICLLLSTTFAYAQSDIPVKTIRLQKPMEEFDGFERKALTDDSNPLLVSYFGVYNLNTGAFTAFQDEMLKLGAIKMNQSVHEEKSSFSPDGKKLAALVSVVDGSNESAGCAMGCSSNFFLSLIVMDTGTMRIENYIDLNSRRSPEGSIYFPEIAKLIGESNAFIVSSGTVFSTIGKSVLFAVRGSDSDSIYLLSYDLGSKTWEIKEKLGRVGYKTMYALEQRVLVMTNQDGELVVLDKTSFHKVGTINVGKTSTRRLDDQWYGFKLPKDNLVAPNPNDYSRFLVADAGNGGFIVDNAEPAPGLYKELRNITYVDPDGKTHIAEISQVEHPFEDNTFYANHFEKVENGKIFFVNESGRTDLCLNNKVGAKAGYSFDLETQKFDEVKCSSTSPVLEPYSSYLPSKEYAVGYKPGSDKAVLWKVGSNHLYYPAEQMSGEKIVETSSRILFIDYRSVKSVSKADLK
jgi:hypothetical protein